MVERGITEQHFLQQMPKDAMRQVDAFAILLELPDCVSGSSALTYKHQNQDPFGEEALSLYKWLGNCLPHAQTMTKLAWSR